MYSYWGVGNSYIPTEIGDRLADIEASANVPLRLMSNGRQVRENSWSSEMRGTFSSAQCRRDGWTIAFGAPRGGETNYPWLVLGPDVYIEVLAPRTFDGEPLEYHDTTGTREDYVQRGYTCTETFGDLDVDNRVIYVWMNLPNYTHSRWNRHEWHDGLEAVWNVIIETLELNAGGAGMTDEERAAARAERARAAFDRYIERVYNGQVQARRTAIDTHTTAITTAQSTIARSTAALIQEQQLLDAMLLVQQNDAAATMRTEFELLESHPRLAERTLSGSTLTLTTTDDMRLHREDSDETRWLGAFRITIDLQSFDINIKNLNTMRGGRHHPHVPGDGHPCFGSSANGFYELLGQGQLYVCYDLLIQYIETVNLRDEWGRYASYWFEVEDERPAGWTPDDPVVAVEVPQELIEAVEEMDDELVLDEA